MRGTPAGGEFPPLTASLSPPCGFAGGWAMAAGGRLRAIRRRLRRSAVEAEATRPWEGMSARQVGQACCCWSQRRRQLREEHAPNSTRGANRGVRWYAVRFGFDGCRCSAVAKVYALWRPLQHVQVGTGT